jgi:hypothetical protein
MLSVVMNRGLKNRSIKSGVNRGLSVISKEESTGTCDVPEMQ